MSRSLHYYTRARRAEDAALADTPEAHRRAETYRDRDSAYRIALGLPEFGQFPAILGNAAGHARAASYGVS